MVMLRMALTNAGKQDIGKFRASQGIRQAYLVDAAQGKKYEVMRDANGTALATGMEFDRIPPGGRYDMFAQFPAPPVTTAMNVYFQGAPPLLDVPLEP